MKIGKEKKEGVKMVTKDTSKGLFDIWELRNRVQTKTPLGFVS